MNYGAAGLAAPAGLAASAGLAAIAALPASAGAAAEAAASGAALINSNVRKFGSLSLARFARDIIATAVAKYSATNTVAPPVFDDIAHSSSRQVSQPLF